MKKRKSGRQSKSYETLEGRRLLAGDSVFFFNDSTGTLHITAAETNVDGADFVNQITISEDLGNAELVVAEANRPQQRFSTLGLTRISYRGTFQNDRFTNLTDFDTRVTSFSGDDNIATGGGDDRVIGGNGNDVIRTGNGNDYAAGNDGDDQILESEIQDGRDRFFGGPGADTIRAGLDVDFVSGNQGNDDIVLGDGNDIGYGGDGDDTVNAGAGDDFVYGGAGADEIIGAAGEDRLLGQDGDDEINGGTDDDSIVGGDGNDIIFGETGNDRIVGGQGDDELNAGPGVDRITAASVTSRNDPFGADTIRTGDDNDADIVTGHPVDTVIGDSLDVLIDTNQVRLAQQARFLDQNRTNPGWNETATGLQYRSIVTGNGAMPRAVDQVRVNYEGTFIDGDSFDANEDISFFLNRVIPGWTEGLQLMSEGGTIELAIPSDLAYGDAGIPSIPGGSTLLFTVDLLEVLL